MEKKTISEIIGRYAAIGDVEEVKQSEFPRHGFDTEFLLVNWDVQTISTYRKKKEKFLKEAKENGGHMVAYGVMMNNTAIIDKESIQVGAQFGNDPEKAISKIAMIIQDRYAIPSYRCNDASGVNYHPFIIYLYEKNADGNGGKLTCVGKRGKVIS